MVLLRKCFNPCYNGKGIIAVAIGVITESFAIVSILVIMERG